MREGPLYGANRFKIWGFLGLMARIAVTGASGFVARHLRRLLARGGSEVVAISRKKFAALGGERAVVSADYEKGVSASIRGADALVHLVGIGRQSMRHRYGAINEEITRKIIGICRDAGVGRIIYLSGLGASPDSQMEYFASKYGAEQMVRESGLEYVIFRPSYIVGRDDPLTRHLKRQVRSGVIEIPGSGRYAFQPVYIGDAARIIADSATGSRFRNRTLDLVGPESITFGRYARLFAAGRAKIRRTDLEAAYRKALSGRGSGPGVDDLSIMIGCFEGDHGKLARTAGTEFESVTGLLKSGRLS